MGLMYVAYLVFASAIAAVGAFGVSVLIAAVLRQIFRNWSPANIANVASSILPLVGGVFIIIVWLDMKMTGYNGGEAFGFTILLMVFAAALVPVIWAGKRGARWMLSKTETQ
jgi:hypothetical protein